MILILTDNHEPTTDLVINWLRYQKKDFIRISYENSISIEKIYFEKNELECIFSFIQNEKRVVIDTIDISSYWYRRSNLKIQTPRLSDNNQMGSDQEASTLKILEEHIFEENIEALRILKKIINKKKHINKYEDNSLIKIEALEKAKKVGLSIPQTLVCSDKNTLKSFYQSCNAKIITKDIGNPLAFFKTNFYSYTSMIDWELLPENFGLSLFQEMVDKLFELRIFYMHGKFYSSAVLSQLNDHTKVDLKRYDTKKPNKVVPYLLDKDIERKLIRLMNSLDLNCGSIDMIVSTKGEYVFLEVNPVGQFEQVEVPCNYGIFKHISNLL